ncbi:hypothetical protein FH972_001075 [Carpinus fangiana]|uniref:Uncharacterized protein n=1 Tax=Carpinus fangiana TaxID=176857 RepID=A0A5N6QDA9_9ROSI|nr:hypothetical protein FH972_001075 [Carpinus fangiana]
MSGAVARGLALNPPHLRLGTPADGLFSVVEVKWSPLCDEASNLWSVRGMIQRFFTVWEKTGLRCSNQRFFTVHMVILHFVQGESNRAWGRGGRKIRRRRRTIRRTECMIRRHMVGCLGIEEAGRS